MPLTSTVARSCVPIATSVRCLHRGEAIGWVKMADSEKCLGESWLGKEVSTWRALNRCCAETLLATRVIFRRQIWCVWQFLDLYPKATRIISDSSDHVQQTANNDQRRPQNVKHCQSLPRCRSLLFVVVTSKSSKVNLLVPEVAILRSATQSFKINQE